MAELLWNKSGMLEAIIDDDVIYTWTYMDFEKYLDHALTPSAYHYMTGYVQCNIQQSCFTHEYNSDGIEARAVDAYFDLSDDVRIELHEQELENLESASLRIAKQIDALHELKTELSLRPDPYDIYDHIINSIINSEKIYNKKYRDVMIELEEEECFCVM